MDWVLFIDDGGVMNDNAVRGAQWQRLLGEFFPPILGGTPEAWAEANPLVSARLWDEAYIRATWARLDADYPAFRRAWHLDWLRGMCAWVGVATPPEEAALALVR